VHDDVALARERVRDRDDGLRGIPLGFLRARVTPSWLAVARPDRSAAEFRIAWIVAV
jgi:hypothetical protein